MEKNISTSDKVVEKNILNYTLYDDIDIENRLFVSWDMFEEAAHQLFSQIKEHQTTNNMNFDSIYALPKGGLCLGVKLAYLTKLPLLMDKTKITKHTLIVDDCVDSGKTLSEFENNITAVMFHKPTSITKPTLSYMETNQQINFCWESKEHRN